MKPRLTFTTVIGREEHGTGEKQFMIWSKPHHLSNMAETVLWRGHAELPVEAVHSVFIYGVSADSGMTSGLHNSTTA